MGMKELMSTPDRFGSILSYLLASEPGFSDRLGDAVVPALESELLQDVAARVQRSGGEASLIVLRVEEDEAGRERARIIVGKMAIRASGEDGDHHVPFDRRCTLGALLAVVGEGASITLRLSDEELELEDLDEAPEVQLTEGSKLSFA
jgi:hypothetical protein